MRTKLAFLRKLVIVLIFSSGCTPAAAPVPPVVLTPTLTAEPVPTMTFSPAPTNIPTQKIIPAGWRISDVVSIRDLSDLTGYTDYEYMEPDYSDSAGGEPAGVFWSKFTATVQIEFRAHVNGGTEKLEDYRTAARPGSLIWLESPDWDTGCFYYLDEWTAEITVVRGNICLFISFVPSAYPTFQDVELGTALMKMFIEKSGN